MKIWITDSYVFNITTSGIDVYAMPPSGVISHVSYYRANKIFEDNFTAGGTNWTNIASTASYSSGYLAHTIEGARTRTTNNINFGTDWSMTFRFIQYGTGSSNDQLYIYPVWTTGPAIELYLRTYSSGDQYLRFNVEGTQRALITKYNWHTRVGSWIYARLVKLGTNIYFRVWIPPDLEPVTWDVSTTCTSGFPTTAKIDFYTALTAGLGTGIDDILIADSAAWVNNFKSLGVSSIWSDDTYLYFGTTDSGVWRSPLSTIVSAPTKSLYKNYPDITSEYTLDIYGNGDYLCVVTVSGIDELHISTADHYYTNISGAQRCFQTASGIYYTTAGNLHAVYDLNSNWTTPSYSYNSTTHESFIEVSTINDLVVVSGVICVGTNAGVVTIFEARGNERTSPYKIYKIK